MIAIPRAAGKSHICWRRDRLPTPVFLGFPYGSAGKDSACNVGDLDSTPGLGRSPEGGHDNPFQLCLAWRIPMDRGAWWATVHAAAAAKSLQSCPTLCDPIDSCSPGSLIPGILQVRTLEWVAISFSNAWKWKVKSDSEVAQLCPTLSNPMDCRLLHPWEFPGKSTVHGATQI